MRPDSKLGVGSYTFRWSIGMHDRRPDSPMTAMEIVDAAAGLDLDLVQFADNLPLDSLSDRDLDALSHHAKDKGIAVEVGVQGFSPAVVERYIAIARILDAQILRVALDAEDARRDIAEIAAQFRQLIPACKAANIRLAIENHFHCPSPLLVNILDAVDDDTVGVCLDVANSICAHEWPEQTIRLLAPYTINLHLKDYRIEPDPYGVGFRVIGVPLGEGALDAEMLFDTLESKDRSYNVVLEHWLPFQETLEATRALEHDWLARNVRAARRLVRQ